MNVSFDIATAKSLLHPTQTDIQLHLWKKIKCYISTLHLVSDHIPRLLEWQGLYVCVCVRVCLWMCGRARCVAFLVRTYFVLCLVCVVCHRVNPLMWIPSGAVGGPETDSSLTEWVALRSGGLLHCSVTPGLCWRMATMACQCCDREASAGAISPLGARRKQGWRVCRGIREADREILRHCNLCLSTGEERGWDRKNRIFCHLSGLEGSQVTSRLHTLVLQQIGKGSQRCEGSWRGLHSTCQRLEYRTSTQTLLL